MIDNLWHALWQDNPGFGKLIVLVLLVMVVRAGLSATRNLKRFRQETASLERVMAKLRDDAAFPPGAVARDASAAAAGTNGVAGAVGAEPLTDPATAAAGAAVAVERNEPTALVNGLADISRLKEGLPSDSLIYERLEAIEKLRARRVKVSPGVLQQLSLAREEARPGMGTAGIVASMATMLGLLGTFVGLASMVQEIQIALPGGSASPDDLGHSLGNVFSVLVGIKTAFSCSLMGMFCAVVASVLNFRLRNAQARLFEKLERFTTEELIPATLPAVEDESLLEQVSFQLERSFSRLDSIFAQNQDALKDLTGAQQAFVEIVQEVRQITRGEASRNLDRVIEQLAQTNRSVVSVVDVLPKIVNSIEAGQRLLVERLARAGERAVAAPVLSSQGTRGLSPGLFVLALVIVGLLVKLVWFH